MAISFNIHLVGIICSIMKVIISCSALHVLYNQVSCAKVNETVQGISISKL